MFRHVRAIAVLLAASWMFVLGTPGLDFLSPADTVGANREKLLASGLVGRAHVAVGDFDAAVRRPIVRVLEPTQKPFRVAQSWHLYRDGPAKIRRLEVRVDGELWFRSQDDEHTWRRPQLTTRRLRPVVESTAKEDQARNWQGLVRWVTSEVLKDRPDAMRVELVSTQERFPKGRVEPLHAYIAEAPDWTARRLR